MQPVAFSGDDLKVRMDILRLIMERPRHYPTVEAMRKVPPLQEEVDRLYNVVKFGIVDPTSVQKSSVTESDSAGKADSQS